MYIFFCGICIYPSRLVTSFGCLPYFEYKGRRQHFRCYAKRVTANVSFCKTFFTKKKKNQVLLAILAIYCCGHKWVVIGLLMISLKCFFPGWNDCNAYVFNDFKKNKNNKNWLQFEFILDFLYSTQDQMSFNLTRPAPINFLLVIMFHYNW